MQLHLKLTANYGIGLISPQFCNKVPNKTQKKGQESFAIPVTDLTDDVIASYLVLDNM